MVSFEVGKVYDITHTRKGTFRGRVTRSDPGSITVEIVRGEAKGAGGILAVEGERIELRRALITHAEVA